MFRHQRSLTRAPEFNIVLFALLLNFPWENWQAPLFRGMAQAPHWEAVQACSRAALGDAVIALSAFWATALVARCRAWVTRPTFSTVAAFTACGVVITAVIERMALSGLWLEHWSYSPIMPVVPLLGIGLSPLLQWLILPPLIVWLVRRQFAPIAAAEFV